MHCQKEAICTEHTEIQSISKPWTCDFLFNCACSYLSGFCCVQSDLQLSGRGVNLILTPEVNVVFSKARMMAPDGRCKTFDAAANGYVRGEGCAVIALKRLSDAVASGDNILALIRGSAVNQDGASGGLTVPSGPSQEAVIRQALVSERQPSRSQLYRSARHRYADG